jgi:hypothetical protein
MEKLKTAATVIGCLLVLGLFFTAADFFGEATGLRRMDQVPGYLLGLASTAGIIGGVYLCWNLSWSNPAHRPKFAACVTLSVFSLFVALAMRDPDSSCYVDWDGRSNSTVCE